MTTVMGAVVDGPNVEPMLVMEFMEHGSLYDMLHNETFAIEAELLLPILSDISQGMRFLHSAAPPVVHGKLQFPSRTRSNADTSHNLICCRGLESCKHFGGQ